MTSRIAALAGLITLFSAASALAQASYTQSFDNLGAQQGDGPAVLVQQGWIFRNQSQPTGTQSWINGFLGGFWPAPQSGAGYMAVTGNSTDFFGGTVSNWAILPAIANQVAGDELRFYVYNIESHNTPRLEVRYSPSGGTSTGSGTSGVGNFTQVLAAYEPIPGPGWNLIAVTLPGNGRTALRYYIAEACNFGCAAAYTGIDSLSVGPPPPPPCNLPPVPAAGQSVTWTAAGGPYTVCENIAIPPGSTVTVEPGAVVNFDPQRQLVVSGTLFIDGSATQPVTMNAPAVFPPMVVIDGGVIDATAAQFRGQVRVANGSTVLLSDCEFSTPNAALIVQELPSTEPFLRLTGCTFDYVQASISDALVILEDNTFIGFNPLLLRGYVDVTATNTFVDCALELIRERNIQPMLVDGIHTTNPGGPGLMLNGGEYRIGPNTSLVGNQYPLLLLGGLTRDSVIPQAGNANDAIDVQNGGFNGAGTWPDFGVPYRLTEPGMSLPGGNLTIDPGVVVEGASPYATMRFRSTRFGELLGTPERPITFRGYNGQTWVGTQFITNATTGTRLEHCIIENAQFGAISSDNWLYADNCLLRSNDVGTNMNSFGVISFAKCRFNANGVGVAFTDLGSPVINNPTNPNSIAGNTVGVDAFEPLPQFKDLAGCWWGDPSGPTVASNPGGVGDSIVGVGTPGVIYAPFLTTAPNAANVPPVVRLTKPGLAYVSITPDTANPDFLLDIGTKLILRWSVDSDDAIVSQRIEFSADGPYPSRYFTLVSDIAPDARSIELTIPAPGYASSNSKQFLRLAAVDAAGQIGFDHVPVSVPSGNVSGDVVITTNLAGQSFIGGDSIPTMFWTGGVANLPTFIPMVVLESDGDTVMGIHTQGAGYFFEKLPRVSTDRARLALMARHNSNDIVWFFGDGYFSIRHDPRMGLTPPAISLTSPTAGQTYAGGGTIPISWSATAAHGVRSFDVQTSTDGGRTWHVVVRDLPASATSYAWRLPRSTGIANVRVRVIVRDQRFQNSSATSGAVSISPGDGGVPGDVNGDGHVDLNDLALLLSSFGRCSGDAGFNAGADFDASGCVELNDLALLLANYGM